MEHKDRADRRPSKPKFCAADKVAGVATAITGFLVAFPDAALVAWGLLPEELKAAIPEHYTPLIGVLLFVGAAAAKAAKANKEV